MTNIAGQTRDETQKLNCPRCKAAMEKVSFGGVTVDRCVSCKGIWFDATEREQLRDTEGAEVLDTSPAAATKVATPDDAPMMCPVCHTPMIRMADHDQPHIHFESCTVCYGVFFDAGEFRDYKEFTVTESVSRLFHRRKKDN